GGAAYTDESGVTELTGIVSSEGNRAGGQCDDLYTKAFLSEGGVITVRRPHSAFPTSRAPRIKTLRGSKTRNSMNSGGKSDPRGEITNDTCVQVS
ncbi:unnamed protein product, partial [Sphacelaria rigidula]